MDASDLPWVAAHERALHQSPWSEGNFRDSLEAGYSCWIAEENGAPVGYGVLMAVMDEAHLLNITVIAQAQGGGRGRGLLNHIRQVARQWGASQLFLEVRPSNGPAQALYRQAGFELIGRRKGYYPGPNGREDALVMRAAP
jgi:ribosomal-protein-alanine N-acetyltransferase